MNCFFQYLTLTSNSKHWSSARHNSKEWDYCCKVYKMFNSLEYMTILLSKSIKSFNVAISNVWPWHFSFVSPMILRIHEAGIHRDCIRWLKTYQVPGLQNCIKSTQSRILWGSLIFSIIVAVIFYFSLFS